MLTIDRLRLQLPKHLRERAGDIARLVADELAALPVSSDLRLERLMIQPVEVHPQAGDREVARAVAMAIHAGICNHVR